MSRLRIKRPRPPEAQLRFVIEKVNGEEEPVLYCEAKLDKKSFTCIAKRYSGKNWINLEPGWKVSGSEPGTDYNTIYLEYEGAAAH